MKFDQSLRYNTVPEWISHYIDYSALKRLIYSLEKLSIDRMQTSNDTERTALIHGNPSSDFDPAATFRRRIDAEIRRVDSFYSQTEEHTFNLVDKLDEDFTSYKAEAAVYEATVATELNNDLESGLASPINTPSVILSPDFRAALLPTVFIIVLISLLQQSMQTNTTTLAILTMIMVMVMVIVVFPKYW